MFKDIILHKLYVYHNLIDCVFNVSINKRLKSIYINYLNPKHVFIEL